MAPMFHFLERIVPKLIVRCSKALFNQSGMVNGTDSATHFLMEEFARRVRVNPRYSLRAYARTLGMSPGALSEVLRNRRPLSLKAAEKVIKALGLTGLDADKLYSFVEQERRKGVTEAPGQNA